MLDGHQRDPAVRETTCRRHVVYGALENRAPPLKPTDARPNGRMKRRRFVPLDSLSRLRAGRGTGFPPAAAAQWPARHKDSGLAVLCPCCNRGGLLKPKNFRVYPCFFGKTVL